MSRLIAVIVLALWMPFAQAANLDRGTKAFENGDYGNARYELEPLAQAGNPEAQLLIGVMHATGNGFPKNFVQAHKWLSLSARAGNAQARDPRDRIASRMTRSQLREAQSEANRFRPTRIAHSQNQGQSNGTQTWALPTGRALVAEIQSGLSRLGYKAGSADGLMGRRTTTAISNFQRQVGLPVNGKPTQSVLLAIREAEAGGVRASRPSAKTAPSSPPVATSNTWYFAKQDLGSVLDSLRELLKYNDNNALRSGVTTLVQRSQWPWNQPVFRDDFSKAAGQGGLDWQVVNGEYAIRDGLRSDARGGYANNQADQSSRKRSDKEEVLNILGAILGSRLQRDGSAATTSPARRRQEPDEVRLAASTRGRFLFRARLFVQDPSLGTAFVMQRTVRGAPEELRLRYQADTQQLSAEHATRSGVRPIASVGIRLEAGQYYNIEWATLRQGRMQVALNGRLIIDNARTEIRGGYDGFAWRNYGGTYALNEVALHTRRSR